MEMQSKQIYLSWRWFLLFAHQSWETLELQTLFQGKLLHKEITIIEVSQERNLTGKEIQQINWQPHFLTIDADMENIVLLLQPEIMRKFCNIL